MQPPDEKKVSPNNVIFMITQQLNENNLPGAYTIIENYARSLPPNGDISGRLRRFLNNKPVRFQQLRELKREIKTLVHDTMPIAENVYLNESTEEMVNDLLFEWKHADTFRVHKLDIRNKILLHGPTGNGKTTVAKYIAKQAELPFYEVKADMIIKSHLGESLANIANLLQSLDHPSLLFWDEIDTIGYKRSGNSDNSAATENNRMVNMMLIYLEKLHREVILVGATNRMDVLDSAFVRRFDLTYEMPNPTLQEREAFSAQMISWYNIAGFEFDKPDMETDISFSQIKLHYVNEARKAVLNKIRTRSEELA